MARCDALQGEGGRKNRAQGTIQHPWHQQGGIQGNPGDVHLRERRCQLLAPGAHRPEQPWPTGYPYCLFGQPKRFYRGHTGCFPENAGPKCIVHEIRNSLKY